MSLLKIEKDMIEQSFMIREKLKRRKEKSSGAAIDKNHIKIWNVILLQRKFWVFFCGCTAQIVVYKCMLNINSSPTGKVNAK